VYRNISAGSYVFRVVVTSVLGERATLNRIVHVGESDKY